jgi:ribonuclease HI
MTADVQLYTDGGCSGNPGPGGWAFILRDVPSGKQKEVSGGTRDKTTNNQMELMAVIQGLSMLKHPCKVDLFTDSVYVGKGISEWLSHWKANGWCRKNGKRNVKIKNLELWKQLDELLQVQTVKYYQVVGHSGHPENERCDELAVAAYTEFCGRSRN